MLEWFKRQISDYSTVKKVFYAQMAGFDDDVGVKCMQRWHQ